MAKPGSKRGILSAINKTAAGLHRAGVIDKATMREFDALCLTPVRPMAPEEIKALREHGQPPPGWGTGCQGRLGRRCAMRAAGAHP